MNSQTTKRKKAAGGITLQQPEMLGATTLMTQGEHTVEDAAYQEKRKAAALKMIGEYRVWEEEIWDLPANVRCVETFHNRFCYRVHCTPRDLFFRLNGEWVKVTEADVLGVLPDDDEQYGEAGKEFYAEMVVGTLRNFCKDSGKVSWTLPSPKRGAA